MGERIFADDWRACQEEHLRAVMAAGDARNGATLVQVMKDIGFAEARLAELGVGQTAIETTGADEAESAASLAAPEPDVVEDVPEVDVDPPPEDEAVADDPADENDAAAQLSLF